MLPQSLQRLCSLIRFEIDLNALISSLTIDLKTAWYEENVYEQFLEQNLPASFVCLTFLLMSF